MKLQVGVKVLIQNGQGQYLLLQRSEPLPDGSGIKWDIPGGRIESDESLEEGLRREVQEETGLHLPASPMLVTAQDIFIDDIDLHVVRLTYIARIDAPARLSNEHQGYKWVSAAEAYALDVDPYLKSVLETI